MREKEEGEKQGEVNDLNVNHQDLPMLPDRTAEAGQLFE